MTHLEFTCSDEKATALLQAARMYDEQAEGTGRTSYSQISKALCGKENATFEELFEAASQVKSRLDQVERERDAAISDLRHAADCDTCKHQILNGGWYVSNNCMDCSHGSSYEWRGACPENTKEETDG